ncbi:cytotoxic T-lymphocyte protein 4 [Pungitius pungitius]|uniref:cytotoxic T-lymphocyte protein 4 n=1 Tax=Pungitius pungitius TaxID=134920 RepID=UPI0018899694|nr:cytotoxic T-lymphocyte protein 4 [Pungitius pungitius]
MFPARCAVACVALTLLSLGRLAWSAVKIIQPYRVVSTNGTARVQCFLQHRPSNPRIQPTYEQTPAYPHPEPEELRVTLLKGLRGTRQFCSSFLSATGQRETAEETEGECSARVTEGAVEVTLSGLKAADTDMYRCEIEVFFPPPYLRLTGNGTLLHVSGSSDCPVPGPRRQIAQRRDGEEGDAGDERKAPVSVPVVVLVTLVMFVLIIIIYFQAVQCKQGRREDVRLVPGVLHKVDAAAFAC